MVGLDWYGARGGGHEKTRRGREKEDEEEKEDECEGKVSPPHCTAEHNAVVLQRSQMIASHFHKNSLLCPLVTCYTKRTRTWKPLALVG